MYLYIYVSYCRLSTCNNVLLLLVVRGIAIIKCYQYDEYVWLIVDFIVWFISLRKKMMAIVTQEEEEQTEWL